jgi:hypothetical protein
LLATLTTNTETCLPLQGKQGLGIARCRRVVFLQEAIVRVTRFGSGYWLGCDDINGDDPTIPMKSQLGLMSRRQCPKESTFVLTQVRSEHRSGSDDEFREEA